MVGMVYWNYQLVSMKEPAGTKLDITKLTISARDLNMETYILQWKLLRLGLVRKEVEVEPTQDEWQLSQSVQRHVSSLIFSIKMSCILF